MKKIEIRQLSQFKEHGRKIMMLTASSFLEARYLEKTGVAHLLLVSDTIGRLRLGYVNDFSVTLEEMIHHTKAVTRAHPKAAVVADMPYLTYETSPGEAARNAGRLIKEGLAHAIRCEGAERVIASIKEILRANIPVMGHLRWVTSAPRLRGQVSRVSGGVNQLGLYFLEQAKLLENTGCVGLVIEDFPRQIARQIARSLKIPVIGHRSGPLTDGELFVTDEIIGMDAGLLRRRSAVPPVSLGQIFMRTIRDTINKARQQG